MLYERQNVHTRIFSINVMIVIIMAVFGIFATNVNAEENQYPGDIDKFEVERDTSFDLIAGNDDWQGFYLYVGSTKDSSNKPIDYSKELEYIRQNIQVTSSDDQLLDTSNINRNTTDDDENGAFEDIGNNDGKRCWELYLLPQKAGTVTLTFQLDSWTKDITLTLAPRNPEISIVDTGFNLGMTRSAQLLLPPNSNPGQTQWTSSDTEVATVKPNGTMNAEITAISEGKATISATNSGKTATKEIQVWKDGIHKDDKYTEGFTWNVEEGKITNTLVGYYNGHETKPGTGYYGAWSSNNTSVITVDNGKITAHSNGTATIYHEPSGQRYECTIVVQGMSKDSDPAKGLTPISEPQGSENATIQLLSHGAQNQSYNPIYFENYLNQGVKAKKLKFTFSLESNKSTNPLTDGKIPQYEKKQLGYINICKTNGKSIGEKVASNENGFSLEGKPTYEGNDKHPERGYGKVTMTIAINADALSPEADYALVIDKAISGPVDPSKQNVGIGKDAVFFFSTKPFIKTESIVLNQTAATLEVNQTVALKASINPTDADETDLTWSSSNSKIAKTDKDGKITGVSPGKAVITASAEGTAINAKCSVTVKAKGKEPAKPVKPPVVKAPVKVKAVCTSYDRVKLTWTRADKETDGYVIYRASSKSGHYKKIKTCSRNTTSFTNKGLKAGKTYYYKLKSYQKINGKTIYSSYSAIKGAKVKPAAPKLKMTSSKGKVTAKWSKAAGTTKYVLYKSTKKNGKFYKARITAKTKYVDFHVKKGSSYYYKIRAYKTVGGKKVYSSYSKTMKIKVK